MGSREVEVGLLRDVDGTWEDKEMTTATGTYTSYGVQTGGATGFGSLLVKTSAGSLAITFDVSDDGTNYYTPYDTDGNALNVITTAITTNTWIVFSPQMAKYIRFVFVLTSATSTVTATYKQQMARR